MFVIHYAEIGIKGKNRSLFEQRLVSNIKAHVKAAGITATVRRRQGNITVDAADAVTMRRLLSSIGGIEYFKEAVTIEPTVEAVITSCVEAMKDARGLFRVTAKRSEKRFPMTSQDIAAKAGEAILAVNPNLKVDLKHPDHTVWIEISPA